MPELKLGGEVFACRATLGAGQLMKLAKSMKGDEIAQLAGMYDFLNIVVRPEDRARLEGLLDADDLDFDAVNEAVGDLMVSYQEEGGAARPTKRSSPSPSSRTRRGGTSRAASSSQGTVKVVNLSSKGGRSVAS